MPGETAPHSGAPILTGYLQRNRRRPGLTGSIWPTPQPGDLPVEVHAAPARGAGVHQLAPGVVGGRMLGGLHVAGGTSEACRPVRVVVTGPAHPKTRRCPDCHGAQRALPCGACGGEGRVSA